MTKASAVSSQSSKVKSTKPPIGRVKPKTPNELVELFPSGIAVQSGLGRPVLILKSKDDLEVMPVWMHPLDAGVAVAELSEASGLTPHAVTKKILAMTGLRLESCTFVELIGHHQYIELSFNPTGAAGDVVMTTRTLRARADEAMSFCLQAKTRFFATRPFMQTCRNLQAELGKMAKPDASGNDLEFSSKKHPYMM